MSLVAQRANTPFGEGNVISERKDGGVNVTLDWVLSDGKGAVAYLPNFAVKGSKVRTPFGTGTVAEQRADGGVNVDLKWILSDGKSAKAYIPRQGYFVGVSTVPKHLRGDSISENPTACRSMCSIL